MTTATRLRGVSKQVILTVPDQISGLGLWLKANAITGLADADPVATWADSSGNGRDATQATSGNRPTYRTNVLNSLPTVRFDGVAGVSGTNLVTASISGSALFSTNAATIFLVMRQTGSQTWNALFNWNASDTSNRVSTYLTYADTLYFDFGDETAGGRISGAQPGGWDDAFHVVELYRSVGTGLVVVDGTTAASGTFTDDLSVAGAGPIMLGDIYPTPALPLKGDLAEILFYNRALTTTERTFLKTHLATKYAITVV